MLYKKLVKEESIFSSISAYVTGSFDPGLLVISGQPTHGISLEQANLAVEQLIEEFLESDIPNTAIEKVKNQAISTLIYSEVELLNRAMAIAFGAVLGNPNMVNEETDKIRMVNIDQIKTAAKQILRKENCSTVFYKSNKEG